ncbi:hypothetical protein Efla_004167 [Eimeria flavescens]
MRSRAACPCRWRGLVSGVHTPGRLLVVVVCVFCLLSVHAEEEMRGVIQEEGSSFYASSSSEDGWGEGGPPPSEGAPSYTLAEIREALETWWPSSSSFDFDSALKTAQQKAKRPLGVWGIETIDRKELLRQLNLQMERFVATEYAKLRAQDPLLSQVSLLSDWNVLLLVRQQLTRERVKTRLTDKQLDELFEGAPRLYPWLPRDVCDWRPEASRLLLARTFSPTCARMQSAAAAAAAARVLLQLHACTRELGLVCCATCSGSSSPALTTRGGGPQGPPPALSLCGLAGAPFLPSFCSLSSVTKRPLSSKGLRGLLTSSSFSCLRLPSRGVPGGLRGAPPCRFRQPS